MIYRIAMAFAIGFCCAAAGARTHAPNDIGERLLDPKVEAKKAELNALASRKLSQTIAEIRFNDLPLHQAIDRLSNVSGAPIFVNWNALGVDRNLPISMQMRDAKLSAALDVVLSMAMGGREKFGDQVEDGVITVSTPDDLAKNVEIRIYDIRDLLRDVPNAGRQKHVDAIIRFFHQEVAPKSWRPDADSRRVERGMVGAIRELQGNLIVTQTSENHRRLLELLQHLRGLLDDGLPHTEFPMMKSRKTP